MRLVINRAADVVTVVEAENLKALSVELNGCSLEQAAALLADPGLGRIEGGHAWLNIAALRSIARPPHSCTWDERFHRAMAYAQRNGWSDPAGEFVRAHIEASPTDAGPPPSSQPSPEPAVSRES